MVVDLRGLHNQQITKFDSRGRVVVGDIHSRPPWRPELLKQGFTEGRRLNLYATLTLLARWAKIAKKKQTIGTIESRYFTEAAGRFMHLLPKKEGEELPSILH